MGWILFLHFRVTNSKLKKKVLPLVTNSMIQFFFSTFKFLTRSWKIKKFTSSYYFEKWKNKTSNDNHSEFLYWNEILYNSDLFENNVGM